MAKLIYSTMASLDGYIEDEAGRYNWAAPDEQVHAFVNDLERHFGTYLYGRRRYETMVFWETADERGEPADFRDYAAIWRAADKVVFSRTLQAASSAKTRIEADFDPDAIRELKSVSASDISIGGSDLAGHAIAAGLVDECHLFLSPLVVGGGKGAFAAHVRPDLELLDERRFDGGVVYLRYRVSE